MTAQFFFSEPKAPAGQEEEIGLWDSIKESSDPATIRKYLNTYPRGTFAAAARRLIAALEKQQQLETLARQRAKKGDDELRQAREELQKAREAAKETKGKQALAKPSSGLSCSYFRGRCLENCQSKRGSACATNCGAKFNSCLQSGVFVTPYRQVHSLVKK